MANPGGQSLAALYCRPQPQAPRASAATATVTSSDSAASIYSQLAALPAAPSHQINIGSKALSPSTAKSDLDELREQNQALALALGKLNPALVKGSPDELKKQLATAKGTRAFIDSVQSHLESPAFLSALDKRNPMYIVASQDHADEVGVVDLEDVEWWTLVPSENGSNDVTDVDDSLSGPYVWVDEDDIVAGVADSIADVVRTIPSVSKLSNADLQAMLAGTFAELRTKTLYGKIWDYGTLAMSSYSWASYALSLYKDPSTVLWVLRTLFTVMKYVCVAVIV